MGSMALVDTVDTTFQGLGIFWQHFSHSFIPSFLPSFSRKSLFQGHSMARVFPSCSASCLRRSSSSFRICGWWNYMKIIYEIHKSSDTGLTGPAIFEWYKVLKSCKQRLKICNMRPTMWVPLASWHRPPRYCLGQSDAPKKILSRLPQGLGILQGFCNRQNTTYIDIFPPTFYIIWYWVALRSIVVMTVSNSLDRRPVEKLRFVDCFLRVWKQVVK